MGDNRQFKRALISAACTLAFAAAGTVHAANWLMLQGTEDPAASARAYVWGFIQASYQKDFSDPNATGGYVPVKLLQPDINSQDGFNIDRARIGVRGTGFPIDSRVNYFALLELGNNGITAGGGTFARVTDASITLNHIHGARIRTGLFKYPGAEEGLQAVQTLDYINFTSVSDFLLNERFPNKGFTPCPTPAIAGVTCATGPTGTGNRGPYTEAQLQSGADLKALTGRVGAFRDVGVQVFDAFNIGNDWELSYAGMIGNGNGIEFSNYDGKYDKYLYLSAEKKFGGIGGKAEGLKFFAWGQWGERLLDITDNSVADSKSYDRDRAGLGVKYMKLPFRATAEYISADGMIFEGPDKPNFYFTSVANGNGADAKANGWYVEGGWYIPGSNFELDVRYDTLKRNDGRPDQYVFDKWTLGMQYHFNPKTRVTLNYEIRNFECDSGKAACSTPNTNLKSVDDRVGVQLTAVF